MPLRTPTVLRQRPRVVVGTLLRMQEVSILSRVRHPNIVKFYGGCLHPPTVFIVEELMEKDLSSLVHGSEQLLALDDVLRWGACCSVAREWCAGWCWMMMRLGVGALQKWCWMVVVRSPG